VTRRKLELELEVGGAKGGFSCGLTTAATTLSGSELVLCCCKELALATIGVSVGAGTDDDTAEILDKSLVAFGEDPIEPFEGKL